MTANGNHAKGADGFGLDGQQTGVTAGVLLDIGCETDKEIPDGRVYHDEHFTHGVRVTAVEDTQDTSRKQSGILWLRASTTRNLDPGIKTAGAVSLGLPMPKWPDGHQSAAFEALAVKKSLILSPPEIYAECAHHGEEKSKYPWYKVLVLTALAGCYVGFGYTTCLLIGGNMNQAPGVGSEEEVNYGVFKLVFGAVGFPFGFTTIIVCGADLYTSLCAYMAAAWWEGKVGLVDVARMLFMSWWGNFIGGAIMAGLFKASTVYDHKDTTLLRTAYDKVSHPWGATFVKGIYANWLVGIATWMGNAAQDLTGKAVGIWLPISAFAMIGFEHCVANQFLFLMAWAQGAHITAEQFIWRNLIPSTLGNFIGGAVCLGTAYAFAYGSAPKRIGSWLDQKLKRA